MSAAPAATVRQRPWLAPVLGVALTALVIVGGVWIATDSLLAGLCGNTEISRQTAPDGRHDAVLFERNCGATTGFATHVSALPAGAPLGDKPGNVLAAQAGNAGPRAPWGGPMVEVAWEPGGTLMIRHDALAEVFHGADMVDGVAIRAEALP